MKRSGRSAGFIFGIWAAIAMIADTMLPEAIEGAHNFS
jgi:hypothetical protein